MMGYQGCNITHVKREANFVADCLAKSGHSDFSSERRNMVLESAKQRTTLGGCRHSWEEIPTRGCY
ncbi:hypothetical protein LINGRAHAP2_LOCUS368 [Linum grandiflorum]